jgi:5-methylcytosine-specific restriction endonuclease McrA
MAYGIASRSVKGLRGGKGAGIAARTRPKQSVSKRLRTTNSSVSNNSHGTVLKKIKEELLDLNPVCGYNKYGRGCGCGRILTKANYRGTIYADHIIPVSSGGATVYGNIQLLCYDCHVGKLGSKNRAGSKLLKASGSSGRGR